MNAAAALHPQPDQDFGGLVAVDDVSFDVAPARWWRCSATTARANRRSSNASPASTAPEDGEIVFDGKPCSFASPMDARSAGIETIYQDLALANNLDVGGNIFLGREMKTRHLGGLVQTLDDKHMREESRQTLELVADPHSRP